MIPIPAATIEEIEPVVEEIRSLAQGADGLDIYVTGPAA